MRLIYVPLEQCSSSYTEYASGPGGIFEQQVTKLIGADKLTPIRPHSRIRGTPQTELSARCAWEYAQTQQLVDMLLSGFIDPHDVLYFEDPAGHLGIGSIKRAAVLANRRTVEFAYNRNTLFFDAKMLRAFAELDEDYDPKEPRTTQVLFRVEGDRLGNDLFLQFAASLLAEDDADIGINIAGMKGQEVDQSFRLAVANLAKDYPEKLVAHFHLTTTEYLDQLMASTVFYSNKKNPGMEVLEAATFGCAPVLRESPFAERMVNADTRHLYKWNNVFDIKQKVYALMGAPLRSMEFIYRKYEDNALRLLTHLKFPDLPYVREFHQEAKAQAALKKAMELYE